MPGPFDAPEPAQQPIRAPRARVVAYHGPGSEVPEELREALRRNHSEPIAVDHALGAMANLCGAKTAVLLLCEPEKLGALRELLAAVERYTPRVTLWQYIPGENPPLRPMDRRVPGAPRAEAFKPTAASSERSSGPATPGGASRSADPFALRLAKDPGASHAGRSASVGDLLTRDEMEALFSEDSP